MSLINTLKKKTVKLSFKMAKHSPKIFMALGIVGMVSSTVLACKATTKLETLNKERKKDLETINNEPITEEYTEEDQVKDELIVKIQHGWKLVKLYAPSIIVGGLSICSIVWSEKILYRRNAAIAAAYTCIHKEFKDYRKRVVEQFGKDTDWKIKNNVKEKEVVETITDEDGKESVVTRTVEIPNYSEYAKFFDESNPNWQKDPEMNLTFLRCVENSCTQKLIADGFLFLNDVYDALGIPKTKAGQIVGWVYDPDNGIGDNYVDFGIYNPTNERGRDFVNGYERSVILDFNVDGNIWDLMA